MKLYFTSDAYGHYLPSVVVTKAASKEDARQNIEAALAKEFPQVDRKLISDFEVREVKKVTQILFNGDY